MILFTLQGCEGTQIWFEIIFCIVLMLLVEKRP